MKLENLIVRLLRACTVTVTGTWIQQEAVEMPQLQSIDEVVEVPEPLKGAVSIPVGALTSEARCEKEKEQQIYVNIEMYDEVQTQLMRR